MAARSIGSGTISFGLISIPVKLYPSTSAKTIAFHYLHAKCGGRIKQQHYCPACNQVVERSDLVRGFEFTKDQYVRFSDEELKALEEQVTQVIDLNEFVPLEQVDPVYFERGYYLGPDKGGEKAYQLLGEAMEKTHRVALAQFVMRGKSNLVLIRSVQGGLMLHTMYYADEVRDFGEIDKAESVRVREGELDLAVRLIQELSSAGFKPEKYQDEYRAKVLGAVNLKVEGKEVTLAAPQVQRGQVIDLMEALKQSLERRVAAGGAKATVTAQRGRAIATDRPVVAKQAAAAPAVESPLSFAEFKSVFAESGLDVNERELQRSYGGLTSLTEKNKMGWKDIRAKVAHLQRDLKLAAAQGQFIQGKAKTLKAARIPLTARDWGRY
ncbi:MAG: Ku protein [Candidatus Binatia bacterium]